MATAYLICFFVGILFVFVTAIMRGVFGGGESSAADAGGHDIDLGGHDIDVAGHDVDIGGRDVDIGGRDAGAGGHDVDVSRPDGDFDTDVSGHDAGVMGAGVHLSPLSPTVVSVFVTSFGGFGYLARLAFGGDRPFIHVPIAVFSGFVLGLGTFFLFNRVFSGRDRRFQQQRGHLRRKRK
ncbi:MAG: hypothetical protein DRP79_03260 [Planctomycetota bacterium]|nr:MAG: hypothetical protein DRP79_03260 [Planctomycetota bacterium]